MRRLMVTITMLLALGGCSQHMLLRGPTGDILQCVGTRGERVASWWHTRESAYRQCVQVAREAGYETAGPSELMECVKQTQKEDKYISPRHARKRCLQQVDSGS